MLHALVDRVARERAIRVLAIKGPVAINQGLRPDRRCADVDVLVDPAALAEFCEAMAALGWTTIEPPVNAPVLPWHSVTFRHHAWPCTVDAHYSFPGFFAPQQVVFEALWARRATSPVAHVDVVCADEVAHSAILGLHALRHPTEGRNRRDLDFLVSVCTDRFGNTERRQLADLAMNNGASDTLMPLLERIGAPRPTTGSTPTADLESWQVLNSMTGVRGVAWIAELRQATPSERPRIARRALWPPARDLRTRHPYLDGRRRILRARVRRLLEGLRDLPRALRVLRSASRRGGSGRG